VSKSVLAWLAWFFYGYAIVVTAVGVVEQDAKLFVFASLGLVLWVVMLWESRR
jgi:hypothetical protein